jgi:hypothetical protein
VVVVVGVMRSGGGEELREEKAPLSVSSPRRTRRAGRNGQRRTPLAALESARARRGPRAARGDALEDTRSSMEDFLSPFTTAIFSVLF